MGLEETVFGLGYDLWEELVEVLRHMYCELDPIQQCWVDLGVRSAGGRIGDLGRTIPVETYRRTPQKPQTYTICIKQESNA